MSAGLTLSILIASIYGDKTRASIDAEKC